MLYQLIAAVKAQIDQEAATLDVKKKELTNRLEKEKKGTIGNALKGILKKQ